MKRAKRQAGFSMVEMIVAMGVMLLVLATALTAFNDALRMNEAATSMANLDQNLRAGTNLMMRDLIQTGQGIPTGGIPVPNGGGAQPIMRPSPPTLTYTFPTADTVLHAITPGDGLGLTVASNLTDMITVLYADTSLPLNQTPLVALAADGSSMTVDNGTPITAVNNPIVPGNLIMFSNAQGAALQQVSRVNGQNVFFDTGDAFNLNRTSAPNGTILNIRPGATFPVDPITGFTTTTATRIWMVSYYLDNVTNPAQPRLVRRVNMNPGQAVAEVLENLSIAYDLNDGVTNNIRNPADPNLIRKFNLWMDGRSDNPYSKTGEYFRKQLATQVSCRSLSYVDRYR